MEIEIEKGEPSVNSRMPKRLSILIVLGLTGFGVISLFHPMSIGSQSNVPGSSAKSYATTQLSFPARAGTSQNWAGYVVQPSTQSSGESSVTGTWTVPSISGRNGNDAQWIGLGGVSSHDLLQMGTVEQMQNGQQTSYVFWEKLPHSARQMLPVTVGEKVSAQIIPAGQNIWHLQVTVTPSSGQAYTKTVAVKLNSTYASGVETSAEWISEDPSNQSQSLLPLGNMGTIAYQNALVNGQPIASAGNQIEPLEMVGGMGSPEIVPTKLGANGESFSTVMKNFSQRNQNVSDAGGRTFVIPGVGSISGISGFNGFGGNSSGFGRRGWSQLGLGNGFSWGDNGSWPGNMNVSSTQQELRILQQWINQQTQQFRRIAQPQVNVWSNGFSVSFSSWTP